MAKRIEEFKKRYKAGMDAHSSGHEERGRAFRFYGNDQWEPEDIEAMEERDRPALTFNKVTAIINAVSGSEITNRFETKFFPRTAEDEMFAEVMTETVRWIRQSADVEHEESAAFQDAAICGMGCTEFWRDYSEETDGVDKVDRVPIHEMLWDPSARKANLTDARWIIRTKDVDVDEAIARWPKNKDYFQQMQTDFAFPDVGSSQPHDQTKAHEYEEGWVSYNTGTHKVKVSEYQRYYLEKFIVFQDPVSGEVSEIHEDMWPEYKSTFMEGFAPVTADPEAMLDSLTVEVRKKVFYRGFYCGDVELEDDIADIQDGFTYNFITGFRSQKEQRVEYFGLIKIMEDPQKWLNKAVSQIIYIMSTNPKGAILAEKGVFLDSERASKDWSAPSARIELAPGSVENKRFQIVKGEYPTGLDRIMEIMREFVSESVAVNPYFLGNVDDLRRVASSAVTSVQQQAMVVLSVLFDSLRKYRKAAGKMHLAFIREFMPEGQIVRIALPQSGGIQQPIPFKRTWVENVRYDVIVDEAPASKNAVREFWSSLQQTQSLELLMNAGIMTPDIIADTVPDVPTSIRERMKMNAMKQDVFGQVMQLLANGDQAGALQLIYQLGQQTGALPGPSGNGPQA